MAIELQAATAASKAPAAADDREKDYQRTAVVGRALADPKRLCVLESLSAGELSVSELAGRVACQVPNMSQHLAVLRSAGLVATRREGSTVFYRLADDRVRATTEVLAMREHMLFDWAARHDVPVAWVLAGGYTGRFDLAGVAELHCLTAEAAMAAAR